MLQIINKYFEIIGNTAVILVEHQIRHTKRNKGKLDVQGNVAVSHYVMFLFPFTSIKSKLENLQN
jgi:hypothetical protein